MLSLPKDGLEVRVSVPATTGNLGPGFDVLGMALELRNEVVIRTNGPGSGLVTLSVSGEGEEELADVNENRLVAILRRGLEEVDWGGLDLEVEQYNTIPLRRGLGSSAAAAIAGALASRRIARHLGGRGRVAVDDQHEQEQVIALSLPFEGHLDNLVPALVGGLCVCWYGEKEAPSFLRLDPPEDLVALLCIPEQEVATADARRVLPDRVDMSDALFSLSRAVLLVASFLEGRTTFLAEATRDRLHQPYRIELLPAMGKARDQALTAGALASWVSGSGSTVLALCREGDDAMNDHVGSVMKEAFDCRATLVTAPLAGRGATITVTSEGNRR